MNTPRTPKTNAGRISTPLVWPFPLLIVKLFDNILTYESKQKNEIIRHLPNLELSFEWPG
jgi:hypothetical protein